MISDGQVVATPTEVHNCRPGVRSEWCSDDWPIPGGHYYLTIPTSWEFPRGTVWACDCGKPWVSIGPRYINLPGDCGWRREGRFARWCRERQGRRTS